MFSLLLVIVLNAADDTDRWKEADHMHTAASEWHSLQELGTDWLGITAGGKVV